VIDRAVTRIRRLRSETIETVRAQKDALHKVQFIDRVRITPRMAKTLEAG
jgi:hypothetical protein